MYTTCTPCTPNHSNMLDPTGIQPTFLWQLLFLVEDTQLYCAHIVALSQLSQFLCYSLWHLGCHGMPRLHAPDHLRSSPTPSAYTPVSLRCTLCKLTQPCHSCHRTKLGSMPNFPGLCPYVSGHHLFVFFSICCICLMHFH